VDFHTEQGQVVELETVSERDAVVEDPFRVAVMTAVWAVEIVPAVAVKVAVVEPGEITTEAGTVSSAVLLDKVTGRQPVGAGPLKVTVQVLMALDVRVWGEHLRLLMVTVTAKLMVALTATPLAVAVTVAVLLMEIVPAETGKLAVLLPAVTLTEAGVDNTALLSESVTICPPVGAALFRVTVQMLTPPDWSVAGLQVNPVGRIVGKSLSEKVAENPPRLAVMVAVAAVATAEVVTANAAVVLPAGTVTEAGVATEALLSDRVTSAPPAGAAPVKVTMQVDAAPPVTEAGLQLTEDTSTEAGTVTTPPLAEVLMGMAAGETADAFVTWIGRLRFEPEERVKIPVATTPLDIVLTLAPLNRQVYAPFTPKQVKDLAALMALGPAVILIAMKSAAE
jgi:hypothetical protein